MRKSGLVVTVGVAALVASIAVAQEAPESLLPPGFGQPTPTPAPTPAPTPTSAPSVAPPVTPGTVLPGTAPPQGAPGGPVELPPVPTISAGDLESLPSLEELEDMSTDDLDDLLGLKPRFDIPPAARRALSQVGVLSVSEGGFVASSFARQPVSLVRAALSGTKGPLVSRWGHILLRRTLVSRLAAPAGMSPVEFAALRAEVLNGLGEFAAARSIAQDVDTGNWNTPLTNAALEAYIGTADIAGACPAVRLQGSSREDAQWTLWQAICSGFAGESALASRLLDRALENEIAPPIDILLAQRFAGAGGRGGGGVAIEWDGVDELNPWRFALANAVGEPIPEALMADLSPYYQRAGAVGAMLPLDQRATYATRAAGEGIFSSAAVVGLYSQIYADNSISGGTAAVSTRLREAYAASDLSDRLEAMRTLWGDSNEADFSGLVLTAYAAARFPPDGSYAGDAGNLIASMLAAGLDRDAAAWAGSVPDGGLAWALISLSNPQASAASADSVSAFLGDDGSAQQRKSAFLVAGLSAMGRLSESDSSSFASQLDLDLGRETRWTQMITRAAEVGNPAMVAMLAGLGMQGSSWDQMTPLHLYHIVSALNQVGLEAEARMIAAEAVARG
ncbi:MAG: hypothetical protein AAGK02_03725 [Pseudomonadota bacterium]